MSNHVVQKQVMHLGIPYLKDMPDEKVRLCAELVTNDATQTMYFEVDSQWKQYLVTELSDAFILGILEKAMKNSYDIFFEQPMSEDLYYSLRTYLIPVYEGILRCFIRFHYMEKQQHRHCLQRAEWGLDFQQGWIPSIQC